MFGSIGLPEIVVVFILTGVWLLPIAVAVWVIVTLQRIRTSQLAIQDRLSAIEQLLKPR